MPKLVSRHERVLVSFGGDTDRDRLKIGSIISVSLGRLLSKKEIDNFYRRNRLAISLSYGDDRSCAGAVGKAGAAGAAGRRGVRADEFGVGPVTECGPCHAGPAVPNGRRGA